MAREWTPANDRLLVSLWHRGDPTPAIGRIFGVSKSAVIARLWKLRAVGWRIRNDARSVGGRPRTAAHWRERTVDGAAFALGGD